MLDITQAELAVAVGVSRAHIASIESGRANPSLDLAWSIAERLGVDLQLLTPPPLVLDRRRSDLVHARCSAYVERRMHAAGWLTAREVEVMEGRTHGWIDLLAFHPSSKLLVVVEIKTQLLDIGAAERQIAWYEREARAVARRRGWQPRRVCAWLVLLASEEVEAAISIHRQLLRRSFPDRAPGMRRVVVNESAAAERGLALIDPTSRRRDWLIGTRSDGRRSSSPYRDYADAARRLSSVSVQHTRIA